MQCENIPHDNQNFDESQNTNFFSNSIAPMNFNIIYDILLGLLKVMNLCEPHSSVFIQKNVNYTHKIYINRNQAEYTLCLCVHIEFNFD